MRRKLIVLIILLVLLVVLVLSRCGKNSGADTLSADAEEPIQQSEGPTRKEQYFGTVTAAENGGILIEAEKDGESVSYRFSDIELDDWCVEAVNFAVSNGLMVGIDDGSGGMLFRPDYGITRAQLAAILYSFAAGEPVESARSFDDVAESDWYYDCVRWASSKGYIVPSSAETFGVDEFCSCEEVLTVLHRVADEPASTASLEDYPYAPKVSESALTATRWAWEKGLIAEDECVWYPTQAVSRAQIALLLMRYDALG